MRFPFAFHLLLKAAASALGLCHAACADDSFAGWPEDWKSAYLRFDSFVAAREKGWPQAGLSMENNGTISWGLAETDGLKNLGMEFYRAGSRVLSMGLNDSWAVDVRKKQFTPGIYAACLHGATSFGYQHFLPMLWFELRKKTEVRSAEGDFEVRQIPPPAEDERVWPNERGLLFLDFHAFPNGYPRDVFAENSKVRPSITLWMNRNGIIRRKALQDPEHEKLLHWRIYLNGTLVEELPATGDLEYVVTQGHGTYQAMLAVTGPKGFFPVSNLLVFPLFPSPSGKYTMFPADSDKNGTPDFLEPSNEEQPAGSKTADPLSDRDNDGIPDQQEAGKQSFHLRTNASDEERALFDLWSDWRHEIKSTLKGDMHPPYFPWIDGEEK